MEIFCDGLCEPTNPNGHACWGFVVYDERGNELHAAHGYIGHGPGMSNNVAEYTAVIEALKWAYRGGHLECTIKTDSQLVVKQAQGEWQVKADHLHAFVKRVREGLSACQATDIVWVPREQNSRADALSREAYRLRTHQDVQGHPSRAVPSVYVEALQALDAMEQAVEDGFETEFLTSMMERIAQYGERTYMSEKQQKVIRRMVETYLGPDKAAEWFHGQTRMQGV